jgi:hypothetical protein
VSRFSLRLLLVTVVAPALLSSACDTAGGPNDGDDGGTSTPPTQPLIGRHARMVWAAETEPEADATGAVESSGWVVVATTAGDRSSTIGLDADDGVQWWAQDIGRGDAVLAVRDDGTVEACSDDVAAVLDPATGTHLRAEATCPDPDTDSPYDVDGSELVVYDDLEHTAEQYRIILRDPDAVVWPVRRGVITYSPSAHEVRLYR